MLQVHWVFFFSLILNQRLWQDLEAFFSFFFFFILRGKELQCKVFYFLYQKNSEVILTENGDLVHDVAGHFVQRSISLICPAELRDVVHPLFWYQSSHKQTNQPRGL